MKANTTLQLMSFLLATASYGPLFAETCTHEERPAIRIHYDANINDGMTLVQDIQSTEERVGGNLGYGKLVLVRSANAQRFAMFGHRLAIAPTKTETIPDLKRIRS